MKFKKTGLFKAFIICLCIYGLFSCQAPMKPAALPETALPASPEEAKNEDPQVAEMQKKIAEAVEEAKRTGKTKVDVFLDENPDLVQTGDLVEIAYMAGLEDGRVIPGKDERTGNDIQTIVAGRPAAIPGLGTVVLGMRAREKKKVVIEPEKAYGLVKPEAQEKFSRIRQIPVLIQVEKTLYQEQFKSLPSKGNQVQINPYFPSEVVDLTDTQIVLRNLARDGMTESAPFGKTMIRVDQDLITISLYPVIGAPFAVGNNAGTIISADESSFLVDFNHSYAGQKVILDVEVISFIKASVHKNMELLWEGDHDQGLERARLKEKPAVLILYADWCQWCEKLFEETFTDPRIKLLKDEFVWVKANSDLDPGLKSFYRQEGFPMIVLMDPQGNIIQKTEGYKDAVSLLADLDRMKKIYTAKADH